MLLFVWLHGERSKKQWTWLSQGESRQSEEDCWPLTGYELVSEKGVCGCGCWPVLASNKVHRAWSRPVDECKWVAPTAQVSAPATNCFFWVLLHWLNLLQCQSIQYRLPVCAGGLRELQWRPLSSDHHHHHQQHYQYQQNHHKRGKETQRALWRRWQRCPELRRQPASIRCSTHGRDRRQMSRLIPSMINCRLSLVVELSQSVLCVCVCCCCCDGVSWARVISQQPIGLTLLWLLSLRWYYHTGLDNQTVALEVRERENGCARLCDNTS